MSHKYTYIALTTEPPQHYARCRCGWVSGKYLTSQPVEDDTRKHDADVQRVLAHLGSKNPSLKGQRDYYRQMAENDTLPKEQRALWKQLADELEPRVGDRAGAQDGLW